MHRKTLLITMLLCALVGVRGSIGATAQETACELEPVTLPLFDATPAAEVPGALATPAGPDDPGRVATSDEVATFEAAMNVLLPCMSSGDKALSFAVFTERYFAARLSDPAVVYQPDVERAIADSSGSPDSPRLVLEAVADVMVRDDGRMSGKVTLGDGTMSWTDILVLAEVEGTWLIDDVIPMTR
jgi:hypothetical protein